MRYLLHPLKGRDGHRLPEGPPDPPSEKAVRLTDDWSRSIGDVDSGRSGNVHLAASRVAGCSSYRNSKPKVPRSIAVVSRTRSDRMWS